MSSTNTKASSGTDTSDDAAADDGPTPAPTFEELPLEKGSILELHSINADFDGLMVEFLEVDKATTKLRVSAMQASQDGKIEEGQHMLVKPRACRRPALKPLKLRQALASIAKSLHPIANGELTSGEGGWRQVLTNVRGAVHHTPSQHDIATWKSLLDKDICCVPAWAMLGLFVEDEFRVDALQRAFANAYAYNGLFDGELLDYGRKMVARSFHSKRHYSNN